MKNLSFGALPDLFIKQLISERFIKNAIIDNIKPSSLDLTINMETLVEIPCSFLPSKNKMPITDTLKLLGTKKILEATDGYWLLKAHRTYVAEIVENINLSQTTDIFARANPKSSTGRSDIHIRLLADFVAAFDTIPEKWNGKLYVLLESHSFDILIQDKFVSMNQIRFFQDKRCIVEGMSLRGLTSMGIIKNTYRNTVLQFSDIIRGNNKIELSLDLRDLSKIPGYVAKKNVNKPLVWKTGSNNWQDFFEPLKKVSGDKALIFEKDRFYILSSRESVHVPRDYACEMVSFDDTLGEFRSHYAGFIDNGWGEKNHRPLTLEMRTNKNMYMYHGQPVAYIVFDEMCAPVEKSYDQIGSNYSDQINARLGKFFS